jgi:hypothetical protein
MPRGDLSLRFSFFQAFASGTTKAFFFSDGARAMRHAPATDHRCAAESRAEFSAK